MKTILWGNYKGGVGKTTSVFQVATYFAEAGKKVLLVDMDPQCSLSNICCNSNSCSLSDYEAENVFNYVVELYMRYINSKQDIDFSLLMGQLNSPIQNILKAKCVELKNSIYKNNLFFIPSSISFENCRLNELAQRMEKNIYNIFLLHLLVKDIEHLDFDYLFIDCPPTSNILIQSAFLESDFYIVPTIVDGISAKGVADYISEIEKTRMKYTMNEKIGGILINKVFMVKKDKKQSKVLIRKVDNSGKRFFLYSWYLTFANKNMVINADYIPNQIAPESEVQLGRVRGLTFNENEAINPYRDLESYIYHITANDPVSEKALQMVIRMYHTGKGAPQSSVLSNYWSSYILPVDSSRTNYDNNENDYYDLQAELERKFDELFGSLNDDDVVQGKTVNDESKNSMQEPQNTELDNLDLDLDNIITLNDEDGNPVQFEFLDLVEYQGKEYVILLPTEEDSEDSGEVVILEVIDTDEGEESYISVDNEENLQAVFNIFKEKFISEFDFID